MQCTACEKELNYLVKNFCPYCGTKIPTSEKFENSLEVAGWEEEFLQKNEEKQLGTPFFVHDLPMTCTDGSHLHMARMAENTRKAMEEEPGMSEPDSFCHNCGKELSVAALEVEKKISQVFTLVVDYDKSVKDAIATGKYNQKDESVTDKNFPPAEHEHGEKEQTFTVLYFSDQTETDSVIAQMEDDGKRPGTLREFFAFREAHPELFKEFTIIALGSTWVKMERFGSKTKPLKKYGYSKGSNLDLGGGPWRNCLFLTVDK